MATEPGTVALDLPITPLRPADLPALEDLLRAHGLPADDCREQLAHFQAIYDDDRLVAAGGLEPAGDAALLRSIVVVPERRSHGLGRRLTEYLLAQARADGAGTIYLLTESAADYFVRLGFAPTPRDAVPPAIAATRQFASLCPDTAVCLALQLDTN